MRMGLWAIALAIMLVAPAVMAEPNGAAVTAGSDLGNYSSTAESAGIEAGSILGASIDVSSKTQYWAGFVGTITEKYLLGDQGSNKIMYEWTVSNPSGWIYIVSDSSFDWSGVSAPVTTADVESEIWGSGNTPSSDEDVDATFSGSCSGTNNGVIPSGAKSVTTNDGDGNPSWETCIFKDGSGNIAFAAEVDSSGTTAFNGNSAHYQALAAAKSSGATTYYFYK